MGYYLDSPITWVPYMNNKDCSQEFCSVYCPQWCYIIVSPPPPIVFPDSNSTPNFSPLVIAIITILACAFLLVIYYTVISKYCGNTSEHSRREHSHHTGEQLEDNQSPSIHEPWHVGTTDGLDEAWINSLTVCKYKKEDGFIEGTDCSVCLSEFEENENIRLLPKCNHAFHLPCIDTWLKSHSNCPMCRANIVCVNALNPPQTQTQVPLINESMVVSQIQRVNENVMSVGQEQQRVDGNRVIEQSDQVVPKTPPRVYSDLGNSEERDTIIEIRGTSLDHNSQQNRVLVADILNMDEDEDVVNEEQVMDFVGMSTSFSSGRF